MSRSRPRTPELRDVNRVRQREETEDIQDRRNTRRFRWWQQDQENQIQQLVNELIRSYDAISVWNWMSTEGDRLEYTFDDLEEHMINTRQNHHDLGNMIGRHWRTHLSLTQLRRMQSAYTDEYGFRPNENGQNEIYPYIPGLNVHRPDDQHFRNNFTPDGEVFTTTFRYGGETRQENVDSTITRENNSQDQNRVIIRTVNRRGDRRRMTVHEYLGAHTVPYPEGLENVTPEYM